MSTQSTIPSVRILPETIANKIAAGEVVERPASVVKELVENAIDAKATRITVRLVAGGRRLVEVVDNGHGMSEQDAILAIERHATSKIRNEEDLDNIRSMGFRGEALASIASVSRFEMVTRRAKDDAATRLRIDGGVLRDVEAAAGPPGTRISVNRLYFNTPARAKFLKGLATELGRCIDAVQRHTLANTDIGFQLFHNDKLIFDVPDHADLRERVALIWGLNFLNDMVEFDGERDGYRFHGLMGTPALSRAQRSHQFFFVNNRPIVNRTLQYGFEEGFRSLLTIGRHPVGIVMIDVHPRLADINVHPSKRECRFRDDRAVRQMLRDVVRMRMDALAQPPERDEPEDHDRPSPRPEPPTWEPQPTNPVSEREDTEQRSLPVGEGRDFLLDQPKPEQTDFETPEPPDPETGSVAPAAVYRPVGAMEIPPVQLFDTYLLVPEDDRLLIIDQHALHERLNYDMLCSELEDREFEAQQLAVPLLVDVPPSHAKLLAGNIEVFKDLGIDIEEFGGNTWQITAVCHLYEESKVGDMIFQVLDTIAQGDLFERDDFMADLFRLATEACKASVRGGDKLSMEERMSLLRGFRSLRPPYTCPHGRPIITELTQFQMEKSFRRRQ